MLNLVLVEQSIFNQKSNYTKLDSRFNNDSNYYSNSSQIISNKEILSQEYTPNKKIFNYFSLNNQ